MDLHGPAGRRGAALVLIGLLAAVAPPASAASPAPTIVLRDVSIRPFGMGYVTTAFFAVADDGSVYLPGGTGGAALFRMAPDGSVTARWAGLDVVPGQPDTVSGIVIDPATGDVWASDLTADRIVHLDPELVLLDSFGATGAGPGAFFGPGGLALEPGGTVVVADLGNNRLQRFTREGAFVESIVGGDTTDGVSIPIDVAATASGDLLVSTLQPGLGRVLRMSPDGTDIVPQQAGGLTDLLFPDGAVDPATGDLLIADAWNGLFVDSADGAYAAGPIQAPGMGTAPFAARAGADGDLWTLACTFSTTTCTLARLAADGTVLTRWSATTPPDLLGQTYEVNGHNLYLQCVGEGSPTILVLSGATQPGWVATQQYLMGRLSGSNRFCTYDRLGLGYSDSSGDPDDAAWWADVEDLQALLSAAGESGPFLPVGYSYGGMLARFFSYAAPDQVVGLLAIDPASEDRYTGPLDPGENEGITTCLDDSCTYWSDIDRTHGYTGGTVAGSLGDLPVIVIGHDPEEPFFIDPLYDTFWLELGAQTAAASSNGVNVLSGWSGHYLPYHHPGLVLEAVTQLVAAATADDHALPPCGPAFTDLGGVCP